MAYRFLIIDDEPVVREGISTSIDWEAHGFELVGACRDGREGLQAIENLRPDVVLTDICMPFVDGLELAAAIGEEYPAVRTLLLTGHDEFEYAQAAIKLKVQDFLLKPITAEELRGVLDALRVEMDRERESRSRIDRLVEQVQASLPVYRERFLNRLVRDAPAEAERRRAFEILDLHLPGPAYITLVVDPDATVSDEDEPTGPDVDERVIAVAIHDLVDRAVAPIDGAVSFATPREETVVLLSLSDGAAATSRALAIAEAISDAALRELGHTVSIGVGEVVTDATAIVRSFRGAMSALDHRFVLGPGQIITIQQVRGGTPEVTVPGETVSRARVLQAITAGAGPEVEAALSEVVAALRRESDDVNGSVVFMHRLLADALHAIEALGVDYREVSSLGRNPFERLSEMKTLGEMER
ncbi:MAG: response regulator [Alkalispirochaeta sp.]